MGLRRIVAMPVTGHGTYMQLESGDTVPAIELDDDTGELWICGKKIITPLAGALRRHAPNPVPDGNMTVFSFSGAPSDVDAFFLVWNGLIMGPEDYLLAGEVVTTAFVPH